MSIKIKFGALFIVTVIATPIQTIADANSGANPVRDIAQIEIDEEKLRQAVASRTLTWLTGSSSNNDYISVGRLANFFGFVALRVSSGHSLSRSAVAKDTLHVLTRKQQAELIELVEDQKAAFERVQTARFEMNRALEGLRIGEAISRDEFLALGSAYGAAEAELGRVIGQRLGDVAYSLSPAQVTELTEIRNRYVSGNARKTKIKGIKTNLSKADKKELVNLAARLMSWTTGNETFNDFEVVGKPSQHFGFVSLRLESNHGVKRGEIAKEVLALLTRDQQESLTAAAQHNIAAFDGFMTSRKQLMRSLEVALTGETIDVKKVEQFGAEMGRAEADMTWAQAMAMLDVRGTMSETQLEGLLEMRAKYTGKGRAAPNDPFAHGRQLYAQCALCHSESGPSIGPSLAGIVDKKIASDPAFNNYSASLKDYAQANGVWSATRLDEFLASPRAAVPGTYMGYNGLDDAKSRSALITYLRDRD